MKPDRGRWLVAVALWLGSGSAVLASVPPPPAEWSLCAPCHGETGAGDGPAVDLLWPRPRDLHRAPLKLGADPESVRRTVRQGIPGTLMPAFGVLPDAALDRVVGYVLAGRPAAPRPLEDELPPARPGDDPAARAAWVSRCAPCHGVEGAGDGPLATGLKDDDGTPSDLYDLRRAPLKGGDSLEGVFRALTRGRPGTPMAPVGGSLGERRALAALIVERRQSPGPGRYRWRLPPAGAGRAAVDHHWGRRPLPESDPPPAGQPKALAAEPEQCGICHPRQYESWSQSRHAAAGGPGLLGQYIDADPGFIGRCNACHAPAAAQQQDSAALRRGVTCAGCHIRDHRKLGPPGPSSMRFSAPGMASEPTGRFARSDFCMPCHNLPLEAAVAGRPLLDTWREWAASRYLPAGVQCQHCHQPDGEHRVPGAHDAEMVRRAVRLDVEPAAVRGSTIELWARVHNVGAGHHFPTTATPRAVLRIRQLGPDGPLPRTAESWAIGRTVHHDGEGWVEEADTRIPAGEVRSRRYQRPRHPDARRVEVSLHLFPDWFYSRFYRGRLAQQSLSAQAREQFEVALAEAESSAILIDFQRLPLPASAPATER